MSATTAQSAQSSPTQKQGKQTDEKSANRPRPRQWGNLFTVATVVFGLFGLVFTHYSTRVTSYVLEHAPADYQLNTYDQLWMTIASFVCILVSRQAFSLLVRPLTRKFIPAKTEKGVVRTQVEIEHSAEKVENHFFDATFYFVSSYTAWFISKDYDWMPAYLGGDGLLSRSFENLPFAKYAASLPTYAFLSFGFRLEGFISHGFLKERGNDYMEMLFHDIITIFLFLGYLYGNWMPIGTLVVIMHDITDCPIHISKGLYSTTLGSYSPIVFIFAQLMWAYFRLYTFPCVIYELSQTAYPEGREQFNGFIPLCVGFLLALQCLHILWFCMFQRINLAVFRKAKFNIISEVGHIASYSPKGDQDCAKEASAKDTESNFSAQADTARSN